ncbi:MAG: hypothetical protein M1834_003123 [Cirrosporium novae-zelandiae]|nr:MAG: hypothetical protein M1834_003123 [Cirrosporium novae-zelandiae]
MSVSKFFITRALQLLRRPPTPIGAMSASQSPTIIPTNVPIEGEMIPGYDPKYFYPANPGDLLNSRYRIVAKVGWGSTSTVWLARDTWRWWWNSNRYVALKIISGCDEDAAKHERNITRRLGTNPSHNGFRFVRTLLDSFKATGPDATHVCLVYEPMREPFWLFQRRWENGKLPPVVLKVYLKFILRGLDHLHSECHIIHTDFKLDNILTGFEDPSVIEIFVQRYATHPMPRKINNGRSIYLSQNDFGRLQSFRILPKIADFGMAQLGNCSEPHRHPIQPPLFHAPEIWNMIEGKDLFRHIRSSKGTYSVRAHLAEMIALLGPPPKILPEREKQLSGIKWSHPVTNPEGKLCQTPREYYRGPFFNSKDGFMYNDLIPSHVTLQDSVISLEGEDKRLFLNFVRKMLQWLPENRKTAKELLEDPWLVQELD